MIRTASLRPPLPRKQSRVPASRTPRRLLQIRSTTVRRGQRSITQSFPTTGPVPRAGRPKRVHLPCGPLRNRHEANRWFSRRPASCSASARRPQASQPSDPWRSRTWGTGAADSFQTCRTLVSRTSVVPAGPLRSTTTIQLPGRSGSGRQFHPKSWQAGTHRALRRPRWRSARPVRSVRRWQPAAAERVILRLRWSSETEWSSRPLTIQCSRSRGGIFPTRLLPPVVRSQGHAVFLDAADLWWPDLPCPRRAEHRARQLLIGLRILKRPGIRKDPFAHRNRPVTADFAVPRSRRTNRIAGKPPGASQTHGLRPCDPERFCRSDVDWKRSFPGKPCRAAGERAHGNVRVVVARPVGVQVSHCVHTEVPRKSALRKTACCDRENSCRDILKFSVAAHQDHGVIESLKSSIPGWALPLPLGRQSAVGSAGIGTERLCSWTPNRRTESRSARARFLRSRQVWSTASSRPARCWRRCERSGRRISGRQRAGQAARFGDRRMQQAAHALYSDACAACPSLRTPRRQPNDRSRFSRLLARKHSPFHDSAPPPAIDRPGGPSIRERQKSNPCRPAYPNRQQAVEWIRRGCSKGIWRPAWPARPANSGGAQGDGIDSAGSGFPHGPPASDGSRGSAWLNSCWSTPAHPPSFRTAPKFGWNSPRFSGFLCSRQESREITVLRKWPQGFCHEKLLFFFPGPKYSSKFA